MYFKRLDTCIFGNTEQWPSILTPIHTDDIILDINLNLIKRNSTYRRMYLVCLPLCADTLTPSENKLSMRAAVRGPHARAMRGRYIRATKVKALSEWLGQCKLLEYLCVHSRPAASACGCAGVSGAAVDARPSAGPQCEAVRGGASRPGAACQAAQRSGAFAPGPTGFTRVRDGPRPLEMVALWRAGTHPTPSSRRCRRRSSGPT
jgi:hypothetical protein